MGITLVRDEEKRVYEADGSRIYYRRISTGERHRIVKRHTKRGKTDVVAVTEALLRHAITGWEGVSDGVNEVPFSPDLVLSLPEDVASDILERASQNSGGGEDLEKN